MREIIVRFDLYNLLENDIFIVQGIEKFSEFQNKFYKEIVNMIVVIVDDDEESVDSE